MSLSKPSNNAPNPATRWYEWNGEHGIVRHYDKEAKVNVNHEGPFTFVLLDELGGVRGWHEASKSGIYSNEVRDTRQEVMVVKAFKGGTLAEGFYKPMREKIAAFGGHFVANCYIAFKTDDGLQIGSIRFKGAALGAWTEFRKANRAQLYKKAVEIDGYTEGKKGRVIFRVPVFKLKAVSEQTIQIATALDAELQEFLTGYLRRTKHDQVESVVVPDDMPPPDDIDDSMPEYRGDVAPDEDSIPF